MLVFRDRETKGHLTVHSAAVTTEGDRIRWVELPGRDPARVYVHGLGATSPAYFTGTAVHPLLAGHRSLLVDLLGHGHSDRPTAFAYTLEDHADTLADALRAARVTGAEVVAHSMGGSVAVVLAVRHPELVSRLVLVDANLDPLTPERGAPGSRGIAAYGEEEFLAGGWRETRDLAGGHWWSTMRLAGLEALHRSATHLVRGTTPRCGSCCSPSRSRAPSCTRRPTASSPARRTWRRRASAWSRSPTAATTSCSTTRRPSPARRPRPWPDVVDTEPLPTQRTLWTCPTAPLWLCPPVHDATRLGETDVPRRFS